MGSANSHPSREANMISVKKEDADKYLQELKTLKIESVNNKAVLFNKDKEIGTLTNMNDQLLREIELLKSEKLNITQLRDEMSNKCQELEERNKALKSEITKYESLPALKQILEIYENLQLFQLDIKMATAENSNDEEGANFTAKIADKKTENVKLQKILEQKSLDLQQQKQLTQAEEQLIQAEKTLEKVRLNCRSFSDNKQRKIIFIKDKIKTCVDKFDKISDTINTIEEQLKDSQKQITFLQNKDDQLKEQKREESEKILTLLDMHYSAMWGIIKLVEPDKSNLEKNLNHDNLAESDGVSPNEGMKYAIVLYNLKESPYDQQKVVDIINSICSNFPGRIEVQRLGAFDNNKMRPIKVFVPTYRCVSEILSNKSKLTSGCYQYIKIAPFNKKKPVGNTK